MDNNEVMGTFLSPVDVAQQINTNSSIFKGKVGCSAELARIMDEITPDPSILPYAGVVFGGADVEPNQTLNSYLTTQDVSIDVFVVLDNRPDITGSLGQEINYTTCAIDLRKCLGGWIPSDRSIPPGITGGGGEYVSMTGSRIIYKISFDLEEQILPEDGYTQTLPDLTEIEISNTFLTSGNVTTISD